MSKGLKGFETEADMKQWSVEWEAVRTWLLKNYRKRLANTYITHQITGTHKEFIEGEAE